MEKKTKDAKPEESQSTEESSTEETEQETSLEETQEVVSEDAKTQGTDKTWESKYKDMTVALRKERSRRKKAEKEIPESESKPEPKTEVQERFMKTEARATIAYLQSKDPTFNERLSLVEDVMQKDGVTVEEADQRVKSLLFDKMASETVKDGETQTIKQLSPNADPEAPPQKTTGDKIKDIQKGYLEVPPEMKEALDRKV